MTQSSVQGGREKADAAPLVAIRGLSVEFPGNYGVVRASGDVSFSIARGEFVALVGESGSGKSVTAMAIMGLVPEPGRIVGGSVVFDGTDLTSLPPAEINIVRARRIGWVSQTPRASLNPAFLIRKQIAQVIAVSEPDVPARNRMQRARALLQPLGFTDPEQVLDAYPHELSGGMCQRVCIAMALAGDPPLIIADEPTTALDVSVQAQILALLRKLNQDVGVSILLVTHDLAVVSALADRTVVLYGGEVQEVGRTASILSKPSHPYTRALLRAIPNTSECGRRLHQLPGQAESPLHHQTGCRFASRCEHVMPICRHSRPARFQSPEGGEVQCHLFAPGGVGHD